MRGRWTKAKKFQLVKYYDRYGKRSIYMKEHNSKVSDKYKIDMCNGPIFKKMLVFALPLMCSSVLQLLFNAADIVVVGKFAGDEALAAVGSNTSLINLLVNLFVGLSIGANVLVSKFYGAKKDKDMSETIHTAMLLSVISGIVLTLVGVIGAEKILGLMKVPRDIIDLSIIYIRIYFLGITATLVYNFGASILRAVGDTKRPLRYLMLSGVVNVVLNLIFVIVFDMSVAGVAMATAISQTLSATLVVRCLMIEDGALKLSLRKLKIYGDKLKQIIAIGLPAGIQGTVFSLSNVVIQSSVNSFGKIVVAGNSAAQNIEGFSFMAMNAFTQAAISFTSQNYGAGKIKRISKVAICCVLSVIGIGFIFGAFTLGFGRQLLGIYTDNSKVIDAGMNRFSVIVVSYVIAGVMDVFVGLIRGMGVSIAPMIVSIIGVCGFRLIWIATVFKMPEYHSVKTVYMSYPITWTLTLIVHIITFLVIKHRASQRFL